MKVKIGVSNRHIHLTEEAYRMLFEKNLTKKRELTQPGEFVAYETVTIENNGSFIENVRIIGPFRKYNQVEISYSDALKLGINPPVRKSGDLKDAVDLVVTTSSGSYKIKSCCIIANRHVHMNQKTADSLRLIDNQEIKMIVDNEKGGDYKAFVKITPNGILEAHIDKDDANSMQLKTGDEVEIKYDI